MLLVFLRAPKNEAKEFAHEIPFVVRVHGFFFCALDKVKASKHRAYVRFSQAFDVRCTQEGILLCVCVYFSAPAEALSIRRRALCSLAVFFLLLS